MRPAVLVSIVITLAAVQQVARADRELRVAVLGQGLQSSEFSTKHDDVTSFILHHVASNHCISGIVHPESVDAAGQWQQAIGTGPYRLVEAGSEGSARLERFEGYTSRSEANSGLAGGKRASIDSLVFRPFASADTALVALKEGRVHFLHDLPFHKLEEVAGAADLKYVIQEMPAWHQIIIQSRFDSLLNKLAMRKAIAHSLDPEALTQELFGAAVGVNHSAVASSSGYHTGIHDEGYLRDAATVETWLKEAGYRGEALTIQASRTPYPLFYAVAEKAAEQLRKSGINAQVKEVFWPEQDANYANNEYQLTSMTFSARTDPALMYSALVGQKSDHGWYLWEDNEAAALVSLATVESQPEKRRQQAPGSRLRRHS